MRLAAGKWISTLLMFGMLGCAPAKAVDISAIQTQAVATFALSLTESVAPLPTASPTLTSLPTFTPPPVTAATSSPSAANACYKLIWIKDKTIPDGTHMLPLQHFTKTWLVQNNGGCAWPAGFTFSNMGGDAMSGRTIVLQAPILVGATHEFSIDFVVPSGVSGLLQSSWRMADAVGNYFGDTLSVNIIVGAAGTSTP